MDTCTRWQRRNQWHGGGVDCTATISRPKRSRHVYSWVCRSRQLHRTIDWPHHAVRRCLQGIQGTYRQATKQAAQTARSRTASPLRYLICSFVGVHRCRPAWMPAGMMQPCRQSIRHLVGIPTSFRPLSPPDVSADRRRIATALQNSDDTGIIYMQKIAHPPKESAKATTVTRK